MCLAVPARVVSCDAASEMAVVELDGIRKQVSTQLLESVTVGDYVLIHVGFALQVLSESEALETLELFRQLRQQPGNSEA